jgi:hypothetical protein
VGFDFAALKRGFFDRDAVAAKVDAGKRRVFGRFGAFVRTRARSSIRKRRQPSPPGQPPSSHAGQLRLIFFAWDEQSQSVVVGPVPFAAKRVGAGVVPGLLERGGDSVIRGKRKRYQGNPFMVPALEHERPKFADQMKNLMR